MSSRRWIRFALPLAVVAGLATMTGVAHVVQQPDPTDASFLSPTSDAGDGARRLAGDLGAAGVRVTVRTHSAEAIADATAGGPVTVFVTTPELVNPAYLERMASLPAQVRLVLVAPGGDALAGAGLAVGVRGPRWTATAPQPGCATDFATAAGPAAVQRWQYDASAYQAVRCYDDGLVEFGTPHASMTLVGAADPFRNDRAGEHGNRALARGLLARDPAVVWLDLHEREPAPEESAQPSDPAPGNGNGEGDEAGGDQPEQDDPPEPAEPREGGQDGGGQPAQGGGGNVADSPLARAFPPAVWATLALLALAALALAAASARRLGAPVAEPLPVRVRAAETVRGLGGLYQRAGARSTSLATLRTAARLRLAEHYGLPADIPADEVAERVAATVGQPLADVRHVLAGSVEDSDGELARAAMTVQNLVRFVTGQQNWQQAPDEENVT